MIRIFDASISFLFEFNNMYEEYTIPQTIFCHGDMECYDTGSVLMPHEQGIHFLVSSSRRKRLWQKTLNLLPSLKETRVYCSVEKENESLWESGIVKLIKRGGH